MNERSLNQDAGRALQDALKLILKPAVTQKTFSQRKTWVAIMTFKMCLWHTTIKNFMKELRHFTLLVLIICFIFYPLSLVHIIFLPKNYFQGVLVHFLLSLPYPMYQWYQCWNNKIITQIPYLLTNCTISPLDNLVGIQKCKTQSLSIPNTVELSQGSIWLNVRSVKIASEQARIKI